MLYREDGNVTNMGMDVDHLNWFRFRGRQLLDNAMVQSDVRSRLSAVGIC